MALDIQEIVWYKRIATFHHAHFACSKKYKQRHFWLGIPSAALAAISGTTIFASWESSASDMWRIIAGILAIMAAIMSAIVTLLNYKERSDAHLKAGGLYGNLRVKIEYFSKFGDKSKSQFWKGIIEDWKKYDIDCPVIPKPDYDRARKIIDALGDDIFQENNENSTKETQKGKNS